MSELLRFFKDMRDNGYGLAEIAAQLGTSAIAEPVAGFAAMYDPQHGADAIREGMTYQPRSQAAQEYSQSVGNAAKTAIKPAMPIIDTWKKGVDIAGQYSPVVGATLRTVPTAIGIAMGAKPALQAGRQVSEGLGAMQGRMIANATAPRTLNTGYMGQRGAIGTQRPLTEFEQAHAIAQRNAALPVNQGGLGLPADNTPMDRAKAMGGIEGVHYSRTGADVQELDSGKYAISPFDAIGTHIGSKEAATQRFNTTRSAIEDPKGVSYPVVMLGNKELRNKDSQPMSQDALVNDLISRGAWDGTDYHKKNAELRKRYFSEYDRIPYINDVEDAGKVSYIVPPKNIRSRFAAFDPFNRDSSNLLATTAPLVPTTALGAYMYNENRKNTKGKQ